MRLPTFWRENGHWNDMLVSVCIGIGLLVCGCLAQWLKMRWLGLLGIPVGFALGLTMVMILGRYFSDSSS